MNYRVAVINHTFTSPSMAGWGWALADNYNLPRGFKTEEEADSFAEDLNARYRGKGTWEWRVVHGPPFVLPSPAKVKYRLSHKENVSSN